MQGPPPTIIDALNDLDDPLAAELPTLLRALADAIEQHYAAVLQCQQQHDWQSRQSSLWPDEDPPF